MKLDNKFYERDIDRRVNPAVTVGEMDDYSIKQEIEEYVFNQETVKNIYKFLNPLVNQKEGKTGVWVSGYYGSGKSHFIKYLFYCLNSAHSSKAFSRIIDASKDFDALSEPNELQLVKLQKGLESLSIAEIIFNIDKVSVKDRTKQRITKVFLNQFNKYRGLNDVNVSLALLLEKPLLEKGQFEAFQKRVKEKFGEDWKGKEHRFVSRYLKGIIELAVEFDPELDPVSLYEAIKDKGQEFTIEFLIDELKEYVDAKGDDFKLVFLLDEVSQYIGSDTSLLLNLQTIVEEVGSNLGTKVWIVCTAQQELGKIVENTQDRTEDFGKILGRFETRISLEGQDTAFITKKRLLDKSDVGLKELTTFYKKNKGDVENQFVFDTDLYTNFKDESDFHLTYPFVPYQFRLISDVFLAFSRSGFVGEGVKNTERAILGITHDTANACINEEVGYFVPFDLFFNDQLETNITHLAGNILNKAYAIQGFDNSNFARRVIKALFMISSLSEVQSITFPANLENLSLLLISDINTPKVQMQEKVQAVLDRLLKENIIQSSEGKYRFLKEDEIQVANEIKHVSITSEDRLSSFYKDVIEPVLKVNKNVSYGGRQFVANIHVDDKQFNHGGDFDLQFTLYQATELEQLVANARSQDLIIPVSEFFYKDESFREAFQRFVKTKKYDDQNSSLAQGKRVNTLNEFRQRNEVILRDLRTKFKEKFLDCSVISDGRVIEAPKFDSNAVEGRFSEMLENHISTRYSKYDLSSGYATNNSTLINNAKSTQGITIKELTNTEQEVANKLSQMGKEPTVDDVVVHFQKPPFGWKETATLDVLLALAKKGTRRFEWRNEEISMLDYAQKAPSKKERQGITIHGLKAYSTDELKSFKEIANAVFKKTVVPVVPDTLKDGVHLLNGFLDKEHQKIESKRTQFTGVFAFHFGNYTSLIDELRNQSSDDKVWAKLKDRESDYQLAVDDFDSCQEFVSAYLNRYEEIRLFHKTNAQNYSSLSAEQAGKGNKLGAYLENHQKPWEEFPVFLKIYKNLSKELESKLTEVKTEVLHVYEEMLNELQDAFAKSGLEDANLIPDKEAVLKSLKDQNSLSELNLKLSEAANYKANYLKLIQDELDRKKAKTTGSTYTPSVEVTIANEMPPTPIETEEELNAYLKELGDRLKVKLKKDKKLFLK